LVDALKEHSPDVLIVRSTKVPAEAIDAASSLALIIRAGAGYDTIDVAYASTKGVLVANCPGKNATAVAELTMGLIISIDRRLGENYKLQKEGKWRKGMFTDCTGLKGRTLGLIGFGNIAQRVAERALAFEMKVLTFNRSNKSSGGVQAVSSLTELLEESDIVSLHVPNNKDTKGMVNKNFLSKMKPDGVLINTSRGAAVNEDDLLAHLDANKNFWFGTDVLEGEPAEKECDWEHPLGLHARVYGSHHIGASTKQAEAEIGDEAVRICQVFAASGSIDSENWVNREKGKSKQTLVVKAKRSAEIYGEIFTEVAKAGWTIGESEALLCEGGVALILKISGEGPSDVLDKLKENSSVLSASVS
jgi:D-3-phosphoglycerate dehydrogenase / 2-oxoglutarate reductase